MHLGDILVGRGLVSAADIEAALKRQLTEGGRLGDNLIAMGLITAEQLADVMNTAPAVPSSLEETVISQRSLLNLMLKFMLLEGCETLLDLAERVKMPRRLVQQLLDELVQQKLAQAIGAAPGGLALSIRHALSEAGRAAAKEALEHNLYLGPAPVSLSAYQDQVLRQRISNEQLDAEALRKGFAGLVVPEHYIRKLLPAVNAGRSVLLFGPPGNGKTTLATRISTIFKDVVYIPYALEIGGQIIKIFDPSLHKPAATPAPAAAAVPTGIGLQREAFDQRWVACKRPVVVTGGEMTLDVLDLRHSPETKFYDAPLHVKALNGMLLIEDFGRQKFKPDELLNRMIVPMENQIDYFKLITGTTFSLPFDVLLIFSTNLQPADLIDPAFLRRMQYKIKLFEPTREEYRQIFDAVAKSRALTLTDDTFDFVVERLRSGGFGLAYYQPRFICDQVVEACKCFNMPPHLTEELVAEALSNLYFDIEDAGEGPAPKRLVAAA
ncbi:MAG: ATP-binding protein [Alphaproteobacteria bacterium]|nr:ATP-binding protein [Alphaproteobacteria bacterium]